MVELMYAHPRRVLVYRSGHLLGTYCTRVLHGVVPMHPRYKSTDVARSSCGAGGGSWDVNCDRGGGVLGAVRGCIPDVP